MSNLILNEGFFPVDAIRSIQRGLGDQFQDRRGYGGYEFYLTYYIGNETESFEELIVRIGNAQSLTTIHKNVPIKITNISLGIVFEDNTFMQYEHLNSISQLIRLLLQYYEVFYNRGDNYDRAYQEIIDSIHETYNKRNFSLVDALINNRYLKSLVFRFNYRPITDNNININNNRHFERFYNFEDFRNYETFGDDEFNEEDLDRLYFDRYDELLDRENDHLLQAQEEERRETQFDNDLHDFISTFEDSDEDKQRLYTGFGIHSAYKNFREKVKRTLSK